MKKELIFSLICLLALFKGYGAELRRSHSCPSIITLSEETRIIQELYEASSYQKVIDASLKEFYSQSITKTTKDLVINRKAIRKQIITPFPSEYQEALDVMLKQIDCLRSHCFSLDTLQRTCRESEEIFYYPEIKNTVKKALRCSLLHPRGLTRKIEKMSVGNFSQKLQADLSDVLNSFFEELKNNVVSLFHVIIQQDCQKKDKVLLNKNLDELTTKMKLTDSFITSRKLVRLSKPSQEAILLKTNFLKTMITRKVFYKDIKKTLQEFYDFIAEQYVTIEDSMLANSYRNLTLITNNLIIAFDHMNDFLEIDRATKEKMLSIIKYYEEKILIYNIRIPAE